MWYSSQTALLAIAGAYLAVTAFRALRSRQITFYVGFNLDRHYSRSVDPLAYWLTVILYLAFAVMATLKIVSHLGATTS